MIKPDENEICIRCRACCKWDGYVYLDDADVKRIAEHLKLDEYRFVNSFCDMANKPRLNLKNNPDGSCIFLEEKGCKINTVKPAQCSGFPDKWRVKEIEKHCPLKQ